MANILVYDPTVSDKLSSVRGVGRYLQILKENFPEWTFGNFPPITYHLPPNSIFINPFFNFLQPPLTMKRIAMKQIAVIHDLIPLKYPHYFPVGVRGNINIFLNKIALKNYDLIVTDSEVSKKDLINMLRLPENRVNVVYPCLPQSFLSPSVIARSKTMKQSQKEIDGKFCLYVGDATWNKNLANLAKALKIINVSCVFVGKVFEKNNRKLVNSFNNKWLLEFKEFLFETKDDKRFVFAGFLPDNELIKLYQQAELTVLPSRDEGFGFSWLEAAQFSTPSVLSDIPVLKEISAGNALFVKPENPQDIADKIGEIFFNKEIRNSLGEKAKKRSEFFTTMKFRKDFLRLM